MSSLSNTKTAIIILVAFFSLILYSCGQHSGGASPLTRASDSRQRTDASKQKVTQVAQNYLDRSVSEYSTGADAIDQKIVLHRDTKSYELYSRDVLYNGEWELEDKGHYEETIDRENNSVTCELDNAKVKSDEDERLGTIFRVKIFLGERKAQFVSLVGGHLAKDTTQ